MSQLNAHGRTWAYTQSYVSLTPEMISVGGSVTPTGYGHISLAYVLATAR